MALPSRVLNSGVNSLETIAICGEGAASIAAAGSTITDATALTSIYNQINSVPVGSGVRLPPTEMGATVFVTNAGDNTLNVYPADGSSTIAGAASNALVVRGCAQYWAVSNTRWEVIQGYGTVLPAAYGSFYSSVTQNAAAINTAYAVTFNTTVENYLVSIGTPSSRLVCSLPGTYEFKFTMQLDKTAAAIAHAFAWFRLNGVDLSNSAHRVSISGSDAETVASWSVVRTLAANDYIELFWAVDDTNVFMPAFAAAAPIPAIPSCTMNVMQVR